MIRCIIATFLFLALLGSGAAWAQDYTAQELDTLVGPIALYPDPLLTNVLVASTHPDQVQAAYDFVVRDSHGDVSGQGWDSSVKSLCSYTDVLTELGGSPDWVSGLGWAMTNQQDDVMDSVQRFRFQAQSAGNLRTDDKMSVIQEGTTIRIEPANPQVIYVPTYDPTVVVVEDDDDDFGAVLGYSAGIAANVLLWQSVFNWNDHCFYRPPVGWLPSAGYYRPYGWQGAGIYNRSNVWNPNRNTVINRPVNINNGTINIGSGNRINNRPANINNRPGNVGNRPGNINNRPGNVGGRPDARPPAGNRPGARPDNSLPNAGRPGNNRPSSRPPVADRARPPVRPEPRPSVTPRPAARPPAATTRPTSGNRASSRPSSGQRAQTRPQQQRQRQPGMGSYTSSGNTARQSNRGAQSRGTGSLSSGGRPGGGRSGGGRSGGGRRR